MDREQDQTKDANVYPPEAEQMRPSHASPGSLLGIPFTLPLLSALVWKSQLQDVTMDKAWLPISGSQLTRGGKKGAVEELGTLGRRGIYGPKTYLYSIYSILRAI